MYMYIYIPNMPAQNCVLCPHAWVFAGCVRTSVKKQACKRRETAKRRNMLACKAQSRMCGPGCMVQPCQSFLGPRGEGRMRVHKLST